MGIGYLFTGDEIKLLKRLFRGENRGGWSQNEMSAANSLQKKKIISEWEGSISIEPFVAAFIKLMMEPEKKMEMEEGTLFEKKGLLLWQIADEHTLSGVILKPYPAIESWFEEEKENLKESLDYYKKVLEKEGRRDEENTD